MNDPTDLLDIEEIARNIAQLDERVRIRFDGHSIVKRSGRLVQLAERAITRSRELACLDTSCEQSASWISC